MKKKVLIVGLGGSLSEHSTSLAALRVALEGAKSAGADTHLLDIKTLNLPFYRPRFRPEHVGLDELVDKVSPADGMIWCSPLYHGTVSGVFKNAIDWLELISQGDRAYLTNKVIGLTATAGGTQGLQAINTMEFMVRALRGWAVPLVVPIAQAWKAIDRSGKITDSSSQESLTALGKEVQRACEQMRKTGTCDYGATSEK